MGAISEVTVGESDSCDRNRKEHVCDPLNYDDALAAGARITGLFFGLVSFFFGFFVVSFCVCQDRYSGAIQPDFFADSAVQV